MEKMLYFFVLVFYSLGRPNFVTIIQIISYDIFGPFGHEHNMQLRLQNTALRYVRTFGI